MTTPVLVARSEPLAPRAAVGEGPVALALARRLCRASDAVLATLRAVRTADVLVVWGPEEALPWVDGVRYLGAEASAPALWLPTTRATSLAAPLVERALRRAHHLPEGPLALLSMHRLVPLARAETPTRAWLARLAGPAA